LACCLSARPERTCTPSGTLSNGFREEDLIDGVKAFNPRDVLDSALTAWRAGAFQLNTWTV